VIAKKAPFASDTDTDGTTADTDSDGLHNACDNCPVLANLNQVDVNGDGTGDLCATTCADDAACGANARCVTDPGGAAYCQGLVCTLTPDGDGNAWCRIHVARAPFVAAADAPVVLQLALNHGAAATPTKLKTCPATATTCTTVADCGAFSDTVCEAGVCLDCTTSDLTAATTLSDGVHVLESCRQSPPVSGGCPANALTLMFRGPWLAASALTGAQLGQAFTGADKVLIDATTAGSRVVDIQFAVTGVDPVAVTVDPWWGFTAANKGAAKLNLGVRHGGGLPHWIETGFAK